jgi:acyl-CoA reductase-like NAD-dependent aldehyde dehydrogenase
MQAIPMLINGAWVEAERTYDVIDPYRHEPVWRAPNSTAAELEKAISAAVAAKSTIANMPGYERAALLRRVGVLLRERVDVIAEAMAPETGKAIRDARAVRTGGIIVNGPSTWRTDQLPYGGIKDSGIGREGPHYAIREMTDERLVVFNT